MATKSMFDHIDLGRQHAPTKREYKRRILLVLGMLCFIALYQWDYINWLSPTFGYYGFEYYPAPTEYLVLAWICSVIPSLWMPLRIKRASQLGYWVLYLTVLIPSIFVPLFIRLNEPPDIAKLMVTLCLGFAICGAGYWVPLGYFRSFAVQKVVFWRCFFLFALACSGWLIAALHRNIHLVTFSEVADLRGDTGDAIAGTLLNYPLMWLYGAINPFMVAWGLYYKRIPIFVAGVLGQVLVYSIFATKA